MPAPAAPPRRLTGCPAGCAFLPPSAPLLQPLIDQINQHKLDFKALVQQAGGRDEKFDLVHTALPGVITLQVYRKLTLLAGELQSLGFTWADKQTINRLSREQVLEMLERSRRYIPALSNNEEWSKMVDQEVYDIRRLPADAELRIRRPVKTHPMINLLWLERTPAQAADQGEPAAVALARIPRPQSPIWATTPPRADRRGGIARLAASPSSSGCTSISIRGDWIRDSWCRGNWAALPR